MQHSSIWSAVLRHHKLSLGVMVAVIFLAGFAYLVYQSNQQDRAMTATETELTDTLAALEGAAGQLQQERTAGDELRSVNTGMPLDLQRLESASGALTLEVQTLQTDKDNLVLDLQAIETANGALKHENRALLADNQDRALHNQELNDALRQANDRADRTAEELVATAAHY